MALRLPYLSFILAHNRIVTYEHKYLTEYVAPSRRKVISFSNFFWTKAQIRLVMKGPFNTILAFSTQSDTKSLSNSRLRNNTYGDTWGMRTGPFVLESQARPLALQCSWQPSKLTNRRKLLAYAQRICRNPPRAITTHYCLLDAAWDSKKKLWLSEGYTSQGIVTCHRLSLHESSPSLAPRNTGPMLTTLFPVPYKAYLYADIISVFP